MTAASAALDQLAAGGRWLLIVGCDLGASSGVPLPFERTRWSPSLVDLVQHWLFRTQSRAVVDSLFHALEAGRPPLGFVGDSLAEQQAWLDRYLTDLAPHRPQLRLADLAAAGTFSAVVSSAYDRLLPAALRRVGVPFREITTEQPLDAPDGALALLREWDDRVFEDTDDRRARESAFLGERLAQLVADADGVLVLAHTDHTTDLVGGLDAALEERPDLPVVWVTERDTTREGAVQVPAVGEWLEELAVRRGVTPSPLVEPVPSEPALFRRLLDRRYDLRPVLVWVPGAALFTRWLEKLPRVSIKGVLSVLALVACVVGLANWMKYREFRDQVDPSAERIAHARALVSAADAGLEAAVQAEQALTEANALLKRVTIPDDNVLTFEALTREFAWDHKLITYEVTEVRDYLVTPILYRERLRSRLEASAALLALGNHPPLAARPYHAGTGTDGSGKDPRGVYVQGGPLAALIPPRPLSEWRASEANLAVHAVSPALTGVVIERAMLDDLAAGRLPVLLDLAQLPAGPLEQPAVAEVGRIAGYVGERAALFNPDGLHELLGQGLATFYVRNLGSGGLPRSLARVRELLARFPSSRIVLSTHTPKDAAELRRLAPGFAIAALADLDWSVALAWLREHTAPDFVHAILQDYHLRLGLVQPLVTSLLVDYYRYAGEPPRSLGVVYDRLVRSLLAAGERGFALELTALRVLAAELIARDGELTREEAIGLVARALPQRLVEVDLEWASSVVAELISDGVLRPRGEAWLAFMDPAYLHLCAAKHAAGLPVRERARFLLRVDERIAAFHAGLYPASTDALLAALLADYRTVEAALRARAKHLEHVNPYLPALRKAAYVARNGRPSGAAVAGLEAILFEQLTHARPAVVSEVQLALASLGTPGVKRFILVGIEQDAPYDDRLIQALARAPDDVATGALERWLKRVAGEDDRRRADRKEAPGHEQGPDGQWRAKGTPAATFDTIMAAKHALTALSQIGTESGVELVAEVAGTAADSRFAAKAWSSIRAGAIAALLRDEHFDAARPLVAAMAGDDPTPWFFLVGKLHALADPASAAVLAAVLGYTGEAPAGPADKRLHEAKASAALSLALLPPELADPVIDAALTDSASGDAVDWRPWAALALAYRARPADAERVWALADRLRGAVPGWLKGKDKALRELRRAYRRTVNEAVALTATAGGAEVRARAFETFLRLYDDEAWKTASGSMALQLARFRDHGGAVRFAVERVLCRSEARDQDRRELLAALGRMGTPAAREAIGELWRVGHGGGRQRVGAYCGADSAEAARAAFVVWAAERRHVFVSALGSICAASDLPRFATWAVDAEDGVRRAAYDALGRYAAAPADAARALMAALAEVPDDAFHILRALAELGSPEAEEALLAELAKGGRGVRMAIQALREAGGTRALLRLMSLQDDPQLRLAAAAAVASVAARNVGRLDVDQVLAALPARATASGGAPE